MVRNYFRLQQTKMSHVSLVGFLLFTQYCLFCYHHNYFKSASSKYALSVTTMIVLMESRNGELKFGDHGLVCSLLSLAEALCDQCTDSLCLASTGTAPDQQTNPRLGPRCLVPARSLPTWLALSLRRDTIQLKTTSSCGS